jgi:hypothetical protein
MPMTKRLQVLMDDHELREIQRLARKERVTTAEWVRQRLREAHERQAKPDVARKLDAIRRGYQHQPEAPAPDIDQMLDEIERGYLDESPPT